MNDYIPLMHIVVGMARLATQLCSFLLPSPSTFYGHSYQRVLLFPLFVTWNFWNLPGKKKLRILRYKNNVIFLQNKISVHIATSYASVHQTYVYASVRQPYVYASVHQPCLYAPVYDSIVVVKSKTFYKLLYSVCALWINKRIASYVLFVTNHRPVNKFKTWQFPYKKQ
jgi:hypothetical protein